MEDVSGCSRGSLFTGWLQKRPWPKQGNVVFAKSNARSCEATGTSEVRRFQGHAAEQAASEPEAARRSGSGHREKPGPPASLFRGRKPRWEGARRKSRKDAGRKRGVSHRSRSSGKQKSVGTHRGTLPALSQGRSEAG